LLGPGALLAVEHLAGLLTQAQPIGHRSGPAGSGMKTLPEGFWDIGGARRTLAYRRNGPRPGYWTRRLCNTFFDNRRAEPARPEPPPVIMLLIVRFPTPRAHAALGSQCYSDTVRILRGQDVLSRTGN